MPLQRPVDRLEIAKRELWGLQVSVSYTRECRGCRRGSEIWKCEWLLHTAHAKIHSEILIGGLSRLLLGALEAGYERRDRHGKGGRVRELRYLRLELCWNLLRIKIRSS